MPRWVYSVDLGRPKSRPTMRMTLEHVTVPRAGITIHCAPSQIEIGKIAFQEIEIQESINQLSNHSNVSYS